MFTKRLGGIEQSFLDYNTALSKKYDVVALINSKCQVKSQIKSQIEEIRQFNKYDPFAIMRIRYVIKKHKPDLIIAHSTRAYVLCRLATKSIPIVAVCHNHNFKHLLKSKYFIAITTRMQEELLEKGRKNIFVLPNMITINKKINYTPLKFGKTINIGFIGSLIHMKGVDILINAAYSLIKNGHDIKLHIAGDGEDLESLKLQAKKLNIFDRLNFLGWVKGSSKTKFFNTIDILCVPSRHEPFGIVLLEGMKYSKPLVTTKTSGAMEVAKDVAIMCECDDVESLSQGLLELISKPELAKKLSHKGYLEVQKYSVEKISKKLHDIVEKVLSDDEDI